MSCGDMNALIHDISGKNLDDFYASHYSSGEDSDDFYDSILSSLEVTPNPTISNVPEEGSYRLSPRGMDRQWDYEHTDPDVNYGEADDSVYVFKGHTDEIYSLACNPLDRYLVATGGKNKKAFLWRFDIPYSNLELQGHEDTVSTVAFSPDGKFLATGSFDGLIKIWDAQLGIIKCTLEGLGGGVEWLKWRHDLRTHLVLAGLRDCSVKLWDADKGTHIRTFNGHASGVTCGMFSPNGKIICTGSNDASLRIWNSETAESINVKGSHYHTGGLTCLSINNDSTMVLTGSNDNTAHLVNLSSGKVIRSIFSHSDSVVCCGFAPKNACAFATGSLDSKLIVWNTRCSGPICICEHKTGGMAEGVTCLLWLAAIPYILTGSTYGKIRMWHNVTGECMQIYEGHQSAIVSLSLAKYYSHIVSISRDHTARVFPINP